MRREAGITLSLVGLLSVAVVAGGFGAGDPQLIVRSTYDTGFGAEGAEVVSVRHRDGMAVLTSIAGAVDILDLSDPFAPQLLQRVWIDTGAGTVNSVAVHPHHDYFLAVTGTAGVTGAMVAHRLSDGSLIASAPAGIQPDAIAISPNGRYAVIANEAEGVGVGDAGGPGSISIVDLAGFNGVAGSSLAVTTIELPAIVGVPGVSSGRTDDIARLPIDNSPNTIEPEMAAFSPDSRFAYVTLQENNAVVRLDLRTHELMVLGLGQTTHLADVTVDGVYQPTTMLTAFREPDAIAVAGRFFITADEGDTRNSAGAAGPRGGRTVSVFDARTGEFIADTGSQLDDAAAARGVYPDTRSNRGGSEPEGLDLTHYRGKTLAAVALERANAVALIDLSNPSAPLVVALEPVGVGPETVKFFRRGARLFVASANEVDGTLTILEVVLAD